MVGSLFFIVATIAGYALARYALGDSYIFGKCCLFDEYKTRQIGFEIKSRIDTEGLRALFKDTALCFIPILIDNRETPTSLYHKTHSSFTNKPCLALQQNTSLSKCYYREKHLRQELAPTCPWKSHSTCTHQSYSPYRPHC